MTSAADHSFGKGDPLTLGVEEEYMLTRSPSSSRMGRSRGARIRS